jgi:hypothetical protein
LAGGFVCWAPREAPAQADSSGQWTQRASLILTGSLEDGGPGWGIGGSVALFRRTGRNSAVGLEGAYQGLGSDAEHIDRYGMEPTSSREYTRYKLLRLTGIVRLGAKPSSVGPYVVVGAGMYLTLKQYRFEIRSNGQWVPLDERSTSLHTWDPGFAAGIGVNLARLQGGGALGMEARWHGLADSSLGGGGLAHYLSLDFGCIW